MNGANVIAAIASFLLPGLGQLCQGRIKPAVGFFILTIAMWLIFLGWIGNLLAAWEAATFGVTLPPTPTVHPEVPDAPSSD
jgi:TM2 domain-containing membrane protein YozV